jgi:metal-responsive CopG/Arc/MetJ family transcriptional regulator
MYVGNLQKDSIMGKHKYGDTYMHRMTIWVDKEQWEQFGEVVPPHRRSETIRKMIKRFIARKKK